MFKFYELISVISGKYKGKPRIAKVVIPTPQILDICEPYFDKVTLPR
jgi:hypothetical protein